MKEMIVLLCALVLACLSSLLFAEAKATVPLKAMTYNIRYDNPSDGADNWKHRREYISSLLRYHSPDLLCIQEGLHNQVLDLAAALPDFAWCGVGREDGAEQGEYAAVFYDQKRFRKLGNGDFWLSATPEEPSLGWDAACIRICTWVRLLDTQTGTEFHVYNTHFDHVGQTARENSARLVVERLKALSAGSPVLLTGDFNAPDTDIVYGILTGDGGLQDSGKRSQLPHHGPAATWHGFYPGAVDQPAGIDFIFTGGGISTLRHATLSEVMDNGHFPSDHLPVLAEVLLP
jgi:endonuclease/exonuclease/phosphatase family metal-dependent hydrolase